MYIYLHMYGDVDAVPQAVSLNIPLREVVRRVKRYELSTSNIDGRMCSIPL